MHRRFPRCNPASGSSGICMAGTRKQNRPCSWPSLLEPRHPGALEYLAIYYNDTGRTGDALPLVERLLELRPKHPRYEGLRKEILSRCRQPRSQDTAWTRRLSGPKLRIGPRKLSSCPPLILPTPPNLQRILPAGPLPPVEAPTGSFILQLFLIPLVIVTMVVLLWLMFSWMAHMGRDNPQAIVQQLRAGSMRAVGSGPMNWPSCSAARTPSTMSCAATPKICGELDQAAGERPAAQGGRGRPEDKRKRLEEIQLKRRMFLCRAIGSFRIPDGVPVLLAVHPGAGAQRSGRATGLEGIATLAKSVGPEKLRDEPGFAPHRARGLAAIG